MVFMDIQMPEMDGMEATRRIRALPGHKREELPIIALTANVFKNEIDACLEAGMDSHVGKPVDMVKILEVLRRCLG
jgi:CheY-like chemotaxis protein